MASGYLDITLGNFDNPVQSQWLEQNGQAPATITGTIEINNNGHNTMLLNTDFSSGNNFFWTPPGMDIVSGATITFTLTMDFDEVDVYSATSGPLMGTHLDAIPWHVDEQDWWDNDMYDASVYIYGISYSDTVSGTPSIVNSLFIGAGF